MWLRLTARTLVRTRTYTNRAQCPVESRFMLSAHFCQCPAEFSGICWDGGNVANQLAQRAPLCTSAVLRKKLKQKKADKQQLQHVPDGTSDADAETLAPFTRLLEEMEQVFIEDLNSQLSLNLSLKTYENVSVKLENATSSKPLHNFGRVFLKSPSMITIDLLSNPTAIKAAKTALEKELACNPQQEGTSLHINVPPMTKERRENMAKSANRIYTDYKEALNEAYRQIDKQGSHLAGEERKKRADSLLRQKRLFDARGLVIVKNKQNALLKEL